MSGIASPCDGEAGSGALPLACCYQDTRGTVVSGLPALIPTSAQQLEVRLPAIGQLSAVLPQFPFIAHTLTRGLQNMSWSLFVACSKT